MACIYNFEDHRSISNLIFSLSPNVILCLKLKMYNGFNVFISVSFILKTQLISSFELKVII